MKNVESKRIILIDGFGLIFKAYYAFIRRPLYNKRGENTSAIFGFFKSFLSVLKRELPAHYLVALDSEGPCFRSEIYPEYKAHRPPAPEDLKSQIPKIIELLKRLGIPHYFKERYEADDLIGALAKRLSSESGYEVGILSSDKDLRQLVDDKVVLYKPDKYIADFIRLDREAIFEDMGIYPEQVIDYLALVGDSSDNIPGAAGIGPKSAVKLLTEWGSVEKIYANIESVKPAGAKKKLVDSKENVLVSQKLATIECDIDIELGLEDMETKPFRLEEAISLLNAEDLRSLTNDLKSFNLEVFDLKTELGEHEDEVELGEETVQLKELEVDYRFLTDLDSIREMTAAVKEAKYFCFDLETTGFDFYNDELICMSIAFENVKSGELEGYVIPCQIGKEQQEAAGIELAESFEQDALSIMEGLFSDHKITKIGQNLKFDIKFLMSRGIRTEGGIFDTMLAEYCLDAASNVLGMKDLAEKYLQYRMIRYTDVVTEPKKQTLKDVEIGALIRYSGQDAYVTYELYRVLKERVRENQKINYLFNNIESPLVLVLSEMEYKGVQVDREFLNELSATLEKELQGLYEQAAEIAGEEFNLNSPKQLREILFEKFELPVTKKTKTGPSTDVDVLKKLATMHALPGVILDYRGLSKIKSTYSDSLPDLINERTGRIHTTYLQTGTQTGRLSSKEPNLQNIPIKTETGRKIRTAFIPEEGKVLLSADYSQIELFLLAEFSRDETLFKAFKEGVDIHSVTASLLYDKELGEVKKEERYIAKAVNFGILYGQSGFSLAEDLGIPVGEASRFIKLYFENYSGVKDYIETLKERCREHGYAETFWGRKRTIPEINDRNKMRKAYGERMAVNTAIQGTAADLIKIAMGKIRAEFREHKFKSQLIMQVHDELIFEVVESELEQVVPVIRTAMEEGYGFELKLKTSVEVGKNWGELH